MYNELNVGVLALQGDFERHLFRLASLNVNAREIRYSDDLSGLDGLIIPGGESTTINNLIDRFSLRQALIDFAGNRAVWGTCAGLIMLSSEIDDKSIQPLGVVDISVIRNGYGRQVYSFYTDVDAELNGYRVTLPASFIRAPLVKEVGTDVKVHAIYDHRPVLLSQGNCLVSSFHSELDDDLSLVKFFLEKFVSVSVLNRTADRRA